MIHYGLIVILLFANKIRLLPNKNWASDTKWATDKNGDYGQKWDLKISKLLTKFEEPLLDFNFIISYFTTKGTFRQLRVKCIKPKFSHVLAHQ